MTTTQVPQIPDASLQLRVALELKPKLGQTRFEEEDDDDK
jgi:hypothetical protein